MKTAVVTGTSTGIGLTTSLHLARNGYKVYAGMRNLAKATPLFEAAKAEDLPIEVLQHDVTSPESTKKVFDKARSNGPIDALINNAGIGGASPLELTPEDEHRQMFETNYFGALRCIQEVIPEMRERQSGCIVNISSVVGLMPTPNQIPYSASKWALESLSEGLAHELYRFGVRVVLIEPGVIMTNIFDNSAPATRYEKTSPYQPIMRRNGKIYASGFERNTQPELVAETILESMTTNDYKLRWPVGADAEGVYARMAGRKAEDYIAMGGDLSDAEYNERFEAIFGFKL